MSKKKRWCDRSPEYKKRMNRKRYLRRRATPALRTLDNRRREERRKAKRQREPGYVEQPKYPSLQQLSEAEKRKRRNLRGSIARKYGMTLVDYEALVYIQEGKCAICAALPKPGKRLEIEHCHKLGYVRGLVCKGCNLGLKWFHDDAHLLRLAIAFLERWPQPPSTFAPQETTV